MKTYRYLYYKLYRIWLKKKDEVENARINAIIILTLTVYAYFMNILLVVLSLTERDVFKLPEINADMRVVIPAILIAGGVINYLLLARRKQHDRIVEEFRLESERKRKRGMMFTILYLVMSIGIPLYIAFFTTP